MGTNEKRAQRANYNRWGLSQFLNSSSTSTVDPFLPIFARSLGATPVDVGILAGIFSLVSISQLLWASFAERAQKHRSLVFLGRLLVALLYLPMILLKHGQIMILWILRFFQGVFASATAPTEISLMNEYIPAQRRTKILPWLTQLGLIGTILGTLLGGLLFTSLTAEIRLSEELAFGILFVWTAVLGIASSLLFLTAISQEKGAPLSPESLILQRINVPSQLGVFAKAKAYFRAFDNFWWFCLFAAVFNFGTHFAAPFFIIIQIESYDLTLFEAGIMTAIATSCQVSVLIVQRRYDFIRKVGTRNMLFPALLLISLSTFAVAIPYYFEKMPILLWLAVSWIFLGLGWGIFNSTLIILLLDILHPRYRATLVAIYNTIIGIVMFFAPVLGGLLVISTNIASVFVFRSVIILLAMILVIRIKDPEIPGTLLLPTRNVVLKHFRTLSGRGREALVVYARRKPRNGIE
ncbi:MAG: MFS transporter [Candidatus Thorarchaeota archaeon]